MCASMQLIRLWFSQLVWLSCLVMTDTSAPPMFRATVIVSVMVFALKHCCTTNWRLNSQFLMLVLISSFWHLYTGVLYTIPGTFRISHSRSNPSKISRTCSIQGRISHSIPGRISCASISLINAHLFYFVPLTVPHPQSVPFRLCTLCNENPFDC